MFRASARRLKTSSGMRTNDASSKRPPEGGPSCSTGASLERLLRTGVEGDNRVGSGLIIRETEREHKGDTNVVSCKSNLGECHATFFWRRGGYDDAGITTTEGRDRTTSVGQSKVDSTILTELEKFGKNFNWRNTGRSLNAGHVQCSINSREKSYPISRSTTRPKPELDPSVFPSIAAVPRL